MCNDASYCDKTTRYANLDLRIQELARTPASIGRFHNLCKCLANGAYMACRGSLDTSLDERPWLWKCLDLLSENPKPVPDDSTSHDDFDYPPLQRKQMVKSFTEAANAILMWAEKCGGAMKPPEVCFPCRVYFELECPRPTYTIDFREDGGGIWKRQAANTYDEMLFTRRANGHIWLYRNESLFGTLRNYCRKPETDDYASSPVSHGRDDSIPTTDGIQAQLEKINSLITTVEGRLKRTLDQISSETNRFMIAAHVNACALDIFNDMKSLTSAVIAYSEGCESDDYIGYDASGIGHYISEIIKVRFANDWAVINSCQKLIDDFMYEFDGSCSVYTGYLIEGITENCMNIFQWLIKEEENPSAPLANEIIAKLRDQPLDARLVDVAPSAGKPLRAAMKDPGGRPKKKSSGTKIATQGEMATSFGAPCTESKIANWEAYERTNGQRGSRPFGIVTKDGEKIIYSAELRTNPTSDNQNRLTALIAEFQSRHRIKEAIGEKARHMKSAETLAKASGQVDAAIRERSQLKYEK